ncbi:MAG TPA: hypothetical protein ENJ32_02415 [Crenotrichaceae bacterium]|nr:hypothetical protein [Crenotrichaceae bacterium]
MIRALIPFSHREIEIRAFSHAQYRVLGTNPCSLISSGSLLANQLSAQDTRHEPHQIKLNFTLPPNYSIPVAGIPIRVTRTYDTHQKDHNLDFGYGWSVDY